MSENNEQKHLDSITHQEWLYKNIIPEFVEFCHVRKQTGHFVLSNTKQRHYTSSSRNTLPDFKFWYSVEQLLIHMEVEWKQTEDFLFKDVFYTTWSSPVLSLTHFSFIHTQDVVFFPSTCLPHSRCYFSKVVFQLIIQHLLVTSAERKLPKMQVFKF